MFVAHPSMLKHCRELHGKILKYFFHPDTHHTFFFLFSPLLRLYLLSQVLSLHISLSLSPSLLQGHTQMVSPPPWSIYPKEKCITYPCTLTALHGCLSCGTYHFLYYHLIMCLPIFFLYCTELLSRSLNLLKTWLYLYVLKIFSGAHCAQLASAFNLKHVKSHNLSGDLHFLQKD